jgi:hypothetical protein
MYDVVRYRSQQHTFRTTAPPSTDDDKVSLFGLGSCGDGATRLPVPDEEFGVGAGALGIAHHIDQGRLPLRTRLIDTLMGSSTRQTPLLEHVDDQKSGLESGGEINGP